MLDAAVHDIFLKPHHLANKTRAAVSAILIIEFFVHICIDEVTVLAQTAKQPSEMQLLCYCDRQCA